MILRSSAVAPIRYYCTSDCRPRCSIEACEHVAHARGLCASHYAQWRKKGVLGDAARERFANTGACSLEGCDQPMRKRSWCASHYAQWKRYGEVKPFAYKWAAEGGDCVVCGSPVQSGTRRRKHCSASCQQADFRNDGDRPAEATCDFCHNTFSLGRERTGRLQRIDTKWCLDCGRDSPDVMRFRNYGITKERYETALALGCTICGLSNRKLHVDHDHACCPGKRSCGKCVRGLICGPCNRGLGLFKDDPAALIRAAKYLSDFSTL